MSQLKPTLITFRGYIALITPHRHLTLGEMSALRNAVNAVLGSDYRRVIIDLAMVDVDCSGAGELIHYYIQARQAGAFIGLMNLTKRVSNLMVIAKLATVFPLIHGNVFAKSTPHGMPAGPNVPPTVPLAGKPGLKRAA